jgi:hypothetical protein
MKVTTRTYYYIETYYIGSRSVNLSKPISTPNHNTPLQRVIGGLMLHYSIINCWASYREKLEWGILISPYLLLQHFMIATLPSDACRRRGDIILFIRTVRIPGGFFISTILLQLQILRHARHERMPHPLSLNQQSCLLCETRPILLLDDGTLTKVGSSAD